MMGYPDKKRLPLEVGGGRWGRIRRSNAYQRSLIPLISVDTRLVCFASGLVGAKLRRCISVRGWPNVVCRRRGDGSLGGRGCQSHRILD